jgi:glycine reductase
MAGHKNEALARIAEFLKGKEIDLFLAGPAFQAGRYGVSCGEICKFVSEKFGAPAVTSMNEENAGVEVYRENPFYILKGGASAGKMREDAAAMAAFANKIIAGEEILWADAEGYFPRGVRKEVFVDKIAADRAVDMLLAKIAGKPFETEYKIEVRDRVVPSKPVADLSKAKIAFISTGGLVPMGNPDRIPGGTASIWKRYDVSKMDSIKSGEFYSVHCGINTDYVNADPGVLVPLAALRELKKEGVIGEIHDYFYSTTGNLAALKDARRMGAEIGEALKAGQVDGAFLVST